MFRQHIKRYFSVSRQIFAPTQIYMPALSPTMESGKITELGRRVENLHVFFWDP